ncbi:DMT family transporter [Acidimangrovimonas sediminis]|uniref:DMT family transporter n=1 Tax=Acidimangrovimonas sediminis TaxID=2056283 RepID=UPI000C80A279|nr:DMT family transporter [Acidimangrovimonas sediminis]
MRQTDGHPPGEIAGVATIVATVFAMALADAIVKYASSGMTLWQIWVLRALIVVPVFAALGRDRVRMAAPGWVLIRSLALVLMYLGIYAAIPLLTLSVIAASLYTSPLFITLLSAVCLREPIRPRQWLAIAVGFAGVVLIVRPAAEGFRPLALIPISAAFLYAVAAVVTRAKCTRVSARTLALWLNLTLLTCGGLASLLALFAPPALATAYPFLFATWRPMAGTDLSVIASLSVLMIGIGVGLARAYQSPRPQVIATFDYSFLIFAAFWGYVFFGEVPDAWTILGMVLISGAGALVLSAGAEVDH